MRGSRGLGERDVGLVPQGEALLQRQLGFVDESRVDRRHTLEAFGGTIGREALPPVEIVREGQGFRGRMRHSSTLDRATDSGNGAGDESAIDPAGKEPQRSAPTEASA
ncbi:hypothetical protein MTE01_14900 [Microbacterium testaceum]|uniref:Uncharacterized protein n=1 Tax=Microbacterium testaceum TaxID=2033 RepID=A0A4Y3QK39_MICTE|nr:hypothetical protein MTE01_14900 [Microbacterium testaceum]